MSFSPFLVIFGIILIFVLLSSLFNSLKSYFTKEKNVKKINIEKNDVVESNETDKDFNKRINQLKTQTKLDWREELKKNVSEKRERYFKEVDNQIIKIISELKDEIEKDAKGENTFGFPMEKFEFDIIDGNNEFPKYSAGTGIYADSDFKKPLLEPSTLTNSCLIYKTDTSGNFFHGFEKVRENGFAKVCTMHYLSI